MASWMAWATMASLIYLSPLGIYFFSAIFNQVTQRDRRLLSEEKHTIYNL